MLYVKRIRLWNNRLLNSSERFRRSSSGSRDNNLRQRLAAEAARIMSEQGVRDFALAKYKAAERLRVSDNVALPSNREIDKALRQYQGIFQSIEQPKNLHARRLAAISAMKFLERFQPRLVGAVLDGSADRYSAVCLHLFCQNPLDVDIFLRERSIPFESDIRRLRFDAHHYREIPVIRFSADGIDFDLSIFDELDIRQAPLDRVTEKPMQRINLSALQALLKAS